MGRNWRRPLTLIYSDNHKYGTSLYSGAIDDIEKRYNSAINRTSFRSDRPDLSVTSFHTSGLGSSGPTSYGVRDTSTTLRRSASTVRSSARPVSMMESDTMSLDNQLRKAKSMADLAQLSITDSYSRHADYEGDDEVGGLSRNYSTRRSRRTVKDRDSFMSAATPTSTAATNDYYYEKCRDLKSELEGLNAKLMDTESKAKQDASALRSKLGVEMQELGLMLEDAQNQNNECAKTLKRQSKMMMDLQQFCEDLQRRLQDTCEELGYSQKRCTDLTHEVEGLKSGLESHRM